MHTVTQGVPCYDVKFLNDGRILVCTEDGMLVLDGDTKEVTRKVASGFKAFSVSLFEGGLLICLSSIENTDHKVVHLDAQYEEVKRWHVGKHAVDIAITNNRVYVSLLNEPDIMVYDIETGAELPSMIHNGGSSGLAAYPPSSLIVSDFKYNSLQKYRIQDNNWAIVWSQKIIKPWMQCVDEHGVV